MITDVLGGRHMPISTIVAHLKGLKAPLGVFAVLGNHDRWEGAPAVSRAFTKAGIPVIAPGEVYNDAILAYLQELVGAGGFVEGATDQSLSELRVVC